MKCSVGKQLALAVLVASALVGRPNYLWASAARSYMLSARNIVLAPNESVYGFRVETRGAVISELKVPAQWNLAVDGSIGGRSTLTANAIHGADSLGTPALDYFDDFAKIDRAIDVSGAFDVTMILSIEDNSTGAERKLRLSRKQLMLSPSSEASRGK